MKFLNTVEKNITPFLITLMMLGAPILLIGGIMIGNYFLLDKQFVGDSISSWVTAIATWVLASLTFVLAKETWYLRENQIRQLAELKRENIRPNVNLQLESSPAGINFINVKLSNLGKGIANKTRIRFLDQNKNEISEGSDVVVEKFRKLAIFRGGVQTLGIGQVISSFIFSFIDLRKELEGEIFKTILNIEIYFEDVEGTPYKNILIIDFAQYQGIMDLEGDPIYTISKELVKIREKITAISGKRIGVDIFSAQDRESEKGSEKKMVEELENRLANSNNHDKPNPQ